MKSKLFTKKFLLILSLSGILLLALLFPYLQNRFGWRIDFALTYLRGVINPVQAVPTAAPAGAAPAGAAPTATGPTATPTPAPSPTPSPAPTSQPSPTPSPTPTPLPAAIQLDPPAYEQQDINNCGPASLAMQLKYFGWKGDQFTISEVVKPVREDRNVNIDELAYFVRTRAGWLRAEYRVNGTQALLKQLIAAGYPVMVEESYRLEEEFWPNDDHWSAHYLLLTGYDEAARLYQGHDSYNPKNTTISFDDLEKNWAAFNHVYLVVFPTADEAKIQPLLGPDWEENTNRQRALDASLAITASNTQSAYDWFNLGTNLLYFERYEEAARAYDTARNLGLPQRMFRYQFGPFIAYFRAGKTTELNAVVDYAIQRTPSSEETMLWRGWLLYRQGKRAEALESFQKALKARPGYSDAAYALDFVSKN